MECKAGVRAERGRGEGERRAWERAAPAPRTGAPPGERQRPAPTQRPAGSRGAGGGGSLSRSGTAPGSALPGGPSAGNGAADPIRVAEPNRKENGRGRGGQLSPPGRRGEEGGSTPLAAGSGRRGAESPSPATCRARPAGERRGFAASRSSAVGTGCAPPPRSAAPRARRAPQASSAEPSRGRREGDSPRKRAKISVVERAKPKSERKLSTAARSPSPKGFSEGAGGGNLLSVSPARQQNRAGLRITVPVARSCRETRGLHAAAGNLNAVLFSSRQHRGTRREKGSDCLHPVSDLGAGKGISLQ